MGLFSLSEIKERVNRQDAAKKFVDKLKEWKEIVLNDGKDHRFFVEIRGKLVISNSWYNERYKWLSYKQVFQAVVISQEGEEETLELFRIR